MRVRKIEENKKDYLELLLLADEQEDMIDRYLERGDMYVLEEQMPAGEAAEEYGQNGGRYNVYGVCVVTDEGNGTLEIKNLAVSPEKQGQGYGRDLIWFVEETYRDRYHMLQVGTGDSPATLPFYEKCGFQRSHVVRNFFTENYDHPIYECGRQLVDMVYLQKDLKEKQRDYKISE